MSFKVFGVLMSCSLSIGIITAFNLIENVNAVKESLILQSVYSAAENYSSEIIVVEQYEIQEPIIEEVKEIVELDVAPTLKWTEEEINLASKILYHEARSETLEGQYAVLEIIENRINSPLFPNDLKSVVMQSTTRADGTVARQFCSSALVNITADYSSSKMVVIDYLNKDERILPTDYIFFATSKANGTNFIQIGNHWFSRKG